MGGMGGQIPPGDYAALQRRAGSEFLSGSADETSPPEYTPRSEHFSSGHPNQPDHSAGQSSDLTQQILQMERARIQQSLRPTESDTTQRPSSQNSHGGFDFVRQLYQTRQNETAQAGSSASMHTPEHSEEWRQDSHSEDRLTRYGSILEGLRQGLPAQPQQSENRPNESPNTPELAGEDSQEIRRVMNQHRDLFRDLFRDLRQLDQTRQNETRQARSSGSMRTPEHSEAEIQGEHPEDLLPAYPSQPQDLLTQPRRRNENRPNESPSVIDTQTPAEEDSEDEEIRRIENPRRRSLQRVRRLQQQQDEARLRRDELMNDPQQLHQLRRLENEIASLAQQLRNEIASLAQQLRNETNSRLRGQRNENRPNESPNIDSRTQRLREFEKETAPDPADEENFNAYIRRYAHGLTSANMELGEQINKALSEIGQQRRPAETLLDTSELGQRVQKSRSAETPADNSQSKADNELYESKRQEIIVKFNQARLDALKKIQQEHNP